MGLQIYPFATVAQVCLIHDVVLTSFYDETKNWHTLNLDLHATTSELAYSQEVIKAQLPLFGSFLDGVNTQTPSNPPVLQATFVL